MDRRTVPDHRQFARDLAQDWRLAPRCPGAHHHRQEIKAGFGFLWCYLYILVTYLLPYALLEILTKRHKFILVSF